MVEVLILALESAVVAEAAAFLFLHDKHEKSSVVSANNNPAVRIADFFISELLEFH